MKRFLPFLLLAAAAGAIWFWFSRNKKSTPLQAHQNELNTNSLIGQVAASALNYIRPPVQTYSSRGPLDGAIVPLVDLAMGTNLDQGQDVVFRPNAAGDAAFSDDTSDGGSMLDDFLN